MSGPDQSIKSKEVSRSSISLDETLPTIDMFEKETRGRKKKSKKPNYEEYAEQLLNIERDETEDDRISGTHRSVDTARPHQGNLTENGERKRNSKLIQTKSSTCKDVSNNDGKDKRSRRRTVSLTSTNKEGKEGNENNLPRYPFTDSETNLKRVIRRSAPTKEAKLESVDACHDERRHRRISRDHRSISSNHSMEQRSEVEKKVGPNTKPESSLGTILPTNTTFTDPVDDSNEHLHVNNNVSTDDKLKSEQISECYEQRPPQSAETLCLYNRTAKPKLNKSKDNTETLSPITLEVKHKSITNQEPELPINTLTPSPDTGTMFVNFPSYRAKPLSNTLTETPRVTESEEQLKIASDEYVPGIQLCSTCGETQRKAVLYCKECGCYLCRRCDRRHDRVTARKHEKLKGQTMPGSITVRELKKKEKCSVHPLRNIRGFCKDHVALCCNECKSSRHSGCVLQTLDQLVISVDEGQLKHESLDVAVKKLKELCEINKTLHSGKSDSEKTESAMIKMVQTKCTDMIEHIRGLEKSLLDDISKTYAEEKEITEENINKSEKYMQLVRQDIQQIEHPESNSKLKRIEKMKQLQLKSFPEYERVMVDLKHEAGRWKTFELEFNEKLFKEITEAECVGKIISNESTQSVCSDTFETEHGSEIDCEENDKREISEVDVLTCWEDDLATSTCITDIQLLDSGSLLISDQHNYKLKLFDENFSLLDFKELSSEPWCISKLSYNKYIVTLPMEKSYEEVLVSGNEISIGTKKTLEAEFVCCAVFGDQILFAGYDTTTAHFLLTDLSGGHRSHLFNDKEIKLFKRPNHILVPTDDPGVVYISDVDRGIFCVGLGKKELLFHYADAKMKCPMGMTFNEDGQILICSQQTDSLYCLSRQGQFVFTVDMKHNRVVRMPQSICYLPHLDRYLLGCDQSYKIVSFKIQ